MEVYSLFCIHLTEADVAIDFIVIEKANCSGCRGRKLVFMHVHFLSLFSKLQASLEVTNYIQFDFSLINLFWNRYYMTMVKKIQKYKWAIKMYLYFSFHQRQLSYQFLVYFSRHIWYSFIYKNIDSIVILFSNRNGNIHTVCNNISKYQHPVLIEPLLFTDT